MEDNIFTVIDVEFVKIIYIEGEEKVQEFFLNEIKKEGYSFEDGEEFIRENYIIFKGKLSPVKIKIKSSVEIEELI